MRETVTASVILAAVAIAVGLLAGRAAVGLGLAAGLVVGSFNGHAVVALLDRHMPFLGASVVRLAALSSGAIVVALLAGAPPWAGLLGVAGAQVVMVVAAVRRGLHA
jgi:hypothetical protein